MGGAGHGTLTIKREIFLLSSAFLAVVALIFFRHLSAGSLPDQHGQRKELPAAVQQPDRHLHGGAVPRERLHGHRDERGRKAGLHERLHRGAAVQPVQTAGG